MKNQSHTLKLAIFFTTMLFAFGIQAQTEKIAFEKYGVAEGLPSEGTFGVIQDHQGFIWVSTHNGLVKFNGYEMERYRHDSDDPDRNQLKWVNSLFLASDSTLWFGNHEWISLAALASYDPNTEKFTNYRPDSTDNASVPSVVADILFEDAFKNIWFTSNYDVSEPSLCKINIESKVVTRYPVYGVPKKYNDLFLNGSITYCKRDSAVWMLDSEKNLLKYNRAEDKFETVLQKWDLIPGTSLKDSIGHINYGPLSGYLTLANHKRMYLYDPVAQKADKIYEFEFGEVVSPGLHFEDVHGNLWISFDEKLTCINPRNDARKDYKFGTGELPFEVIGNLVKITPEAQNERFLYFQIYSRNQWGDLRFATLRYDFEADKFFFFDRKFNDDKNLQTWNWSYPVPNYLLDQSGLLWLSKSSNLFKESPKKRRIELFTSDDNGEKSLPYDEVYSLFEDSKQRIWVCMKKGLALVDKDKGFKTYPLKGRDGSTAPAKSTYEVFEDSQGQIWARSMGEEKGLFRLDETKQEFMVCSSKIGQNIWAITEDDRGRIWVSDYAEGITVLDRETALPIQNFHPKDKDQHGLLDDRISRIFCDSKGNLWTGKTTSGWGIFRFIEETNTFKHYAPNKDDSLALYDGYVQKLFEDDQNRLWVLTYKGLHLYDHQEDVFHRHDITGQIMNKIINGKDDDLWLTTYEDNGLVHIDLSADTVEFYDEKEGLLHNDANNLILDDGRIWLPTQRGLSVFDIQTKTFSNYFEKDGFQEYSIKNPVLKTSDGAIWIGGNHGLNKINPEKLFEVDQSTPNVVITQMGIEDSIYRQPDGDLFSKAVSATDELTLEHWQKDMSFSFVGLHYLRPEDNQYSWKLENYDKKWSEPTKDRTTSYTNLSPGTYTFKVKASNADGFWSDEKAMTITILPPWWQTWWAYSLYAILLLAIGYRVHRAQRQRTIRKEREKVQQRELEQAKEIEEAYKELKSTQAQLVQSEKMASLGELTAGIAHEIQNPLNFVNNFSEVSSELLIELKEELGKGDIDEAKAISDDVIQNLEKITHHGKRADAIVKGMLAHSRSGKGEKEPTDINALAEEYLKLSYHGLRAKDKSFNADFKTDFDPDLPKVNVVPQDIGRVLLNLINNAFQAVSAEAFAKEGSDYNPLVSIKTQLSTSDQILLTITDNGPGIPNSIKDKIFQPFFTTKPTGQGTGLGLSLSYDIVKAHGGTITVKSTENKGLPAGEARTEFTIQLPI